MLPEVLPTVDPELGALVHAELDRHGVDVHTAHHCHPGAARRQRDCPAACRRQPDRTARPIGWDVDLVLVVVGVRPDTDLLVRAGASTGIRGAVAVDESMATGLPRDLGGRATAWSPTTASSVSPTCRWAPPPTSRAGWPARTRSADRPGSPASSAPRWSRCSTWSPPAPDSATPKPGPPATTQRRSSPRPTTTRPTTRARTPSPSGSPATGPPAGCSAPSWSAGGAPRPPNGSTPTPRRCSTT